MIGEAIQLATIETISPQLTGPAPKATSAKPRIPPMIDWPVDTGMPNVDITSRNVPAPTSDASMPMTNRSGWAATTSGLIKPPLMVWVTSPPASQAPRNSKMPAMMTACQMVTAPEPTDVPMALATSLAPMPQAMKKPKTHARMSSSSVCCAIRDMSESLPDRRARQPIPVVRSRTTARNQWRRPDKSSSLRIDARDESQAAMTGQGQVVTRVCNHQPARGTGR